MRLQNNVAVITGSGSGIGQVMARLFAQEGARLVVMDRFGDLAQTTAQQILSAGGEALAIEADVTSQEDVEAMVATTLEHYSQLDILVNNAAIAGGLDILETDEATWLSDLDVVLKGVFLCCQATIPAMIAQKRGAIVNIGSVNGLAAFGHVAYSAAKAGVINLTKNLAVTYGEYNIRANAICPGTIRTPIWQERVEADPQIFERLAKWYPLGRVGEPEDVAKAALFLASDDAAWITGETLTVDGGLMAGPYRMIRELEARSPEQLAKRAT